MKEKPLGIRFGLLAILLAVAAVALLTRPIRKGMDLEGGHSLIFKVDTAGDRAVLAQVISTLQERVDPQGIKNLSWRPAGNDRLEVRMPVGSEQARTFKAEYLKALESLGEYNVDPATIRAIMNADAERRNVLIHEKVGMQTERGKMLLEAASLYDREMAEMKRIEAPLKALQEQLAALRAKGPEARAQVDEVVQKIDELRGNYDELRGQYGDKLAAIRERNLNTREVSNILGLYVSRTAGEGMKPADVDERSKLFGERLKDFKERYPLVADQIDALVAKYKQWADVRGRLDDPDDLIRLIRRAGVLEFRIVPLLGRTIKPEEAQSYIDQLVRSGPQPGHDRRDRFQWFATRDANVPGVTHTVGGQMYVLLSDEPGSRMLRGKGDKPWDLSRAQPWTDEKGFPEVQFEFKSNGKAIFADLTGSHVGEPMAILLDDEVYSAPNIQSQILGSGVITGRFTQAEVNELCLTLNAGALRAKVNPDPVAVHSVGPTLGAANIIRGERAAYIGLLVVAVFMAVYYLFGGIVADFALALNLFLTLAAMAAFDVVLTLPGIAGLILTCGMAVDANVLIFERLREEQAKAQSLKSAIRAAYERAFSAILDSNVTTIITCIVLAWVGSQEIRGFGITLAIGLAISMFTALLVTRWILDLGANHNLLGNKLPMLRLIGVPKVNWFAKSHTFWVVSGVMLVTGAVALVSQGRSLLGIEFRQGSRAVVRLSDDAVIDGKLPNDSRVETLLKEKAAAMGPQYAELAGQNVQINELRSDDRVADFVATYDAKVNGGNEDGVVNRPEWDAKGRKAAAFELLDSNRDGKLAAAELNKTLPQPRYQITSSEHNLATVTQVIEQSLRDALPTQRSLANKFQVLADAPVPDLDLTIGPEGYHEVTDADFTRPTAGGAFREVLQDNVGAAMIVFKLTDGQESLSVAELQQRLRTTRLQPGREELSVVHTEVLPLKQAPDSDKYTEFAVLERTTDLPTGEHRAEAFRKFAADELSLLTDSLTNSKSLESLTVIDPTQSKDASTRAIFAIVVSWIAMIAYLWIRFGRFIWGFAAVVCLIHDSLVVLGCVAFSTWVSQTGLGKALMIDPFKIDLAMVAAVLTIIGYSVNDTIVIFDRIRENRGKLGYVTPENINNSVNQTLSRTILTAGTVFLVCAVMYIFGGDGIHGFNFAMLIGVIVGCYSTVAIAAPLLLAFKRSALRKALALSPVERQPAGK